MFAWLILILGCADVAVTPIDESPSETNMMMNVCPPELTREDGSCWVSDPSQYNEYVNQNGTMPTSEELLNVDDTIIQEYMAIVIFAVHCVKFLCERMFVVELSERNLFLNTGQ